MFVRGRTSWGRFQDGSCLHLGGTSYTVHTLLSPRLQMPTTIILGRPFVPYPQPRYIKMRCSETLDSDATVCSQISSKKAVLDHIPTTYLVISPICPSTLSVSSMDSEHPPVFTLHPLTPLAAQIVRHAKNRRYHEPGNGQGSLTFGVGHVSYFPGRFLSIGCLEAGVNDVILPADGTYAQSVILSPTLLTLLTLITIYLV